MRSPAPARFGASRRGAILGAAAGYALMALIVAAIGFPVLWMVLGAFKTSADIYTSPPAKPRAAPIAKPGWGRHAGASGRSRRSKRHRGGATTRPRCR